MCVVSACSGGTAVDAGRDAGDVRDAGVRDAGPRDAGVLDRDGGVLIFHDGGGPIACSSTCNCPQGSACIDEVCQRVGRPVYCCEKSGCPEGVACLDTLDRPGVCEGGPGLPDGGNCRYDGGPPNTTPQQLGGGCAADDDCIPGLTCWTRDEPPGFWGYCTVEDCDLLGCPANASCFEFNDVVRTTGCLQHCDSEDDCRDDAYCLEVPQLPAARGVCVPNCRDDLLDCPPANGSAFCNDSTGRCEATPSQFASPRLGGRCHSNVDCGMGEVCLGEIGWGYPCGMCGQVCAGLPEAVPCPAGSTCQPVASIGVCYPNCTAEGTCPRRSDAVCGMLDGWMTPSCVPLP